MQGGTFEQGEEKQRSGIYFRFYSAAQERAQIGDRGVALLPMVLGWGEPEKIIEIDNDEDVLLHFNARLRDDPSLLSLREAKKNARTVKIYRINKGEKASVTVGELIVEARYSGVKGNDITIVIQPNILDEEKKDVITLLKGARFNTQTVSKVSELQDNRLVSFKSAMGSDAEITDTAGSRLTGGENGTPANEDYIKFFEVCKTEHFDTVGLPVDDEALKAAFTELIKEIRDGQGRKVRGVAANLAADYEGIDDILNGVVLENGEVLRAVDTVPWVTGASAGAPITVSNTFKEYEGAVDVFPRLSDHEVLEGLRDGKFMFSYDMVDKKVTVEKDINSFVSFTEEKNYRFSKNRVIRTLDAINNDMTRLMKEAIKTHKNRGRDISTDDDGAAHLKTLGTVYMNELQTVGAVKNFTSEDITVSIRDDESFDIGIFAQPIDSGEKFYIGVGVR